MTGERMPVKKFSFDDPEQLFIEVRNLVDEYFEAKQRGDHKRAHHIIRDFKALAQQKRHDHIDLDKAITERIRKEITRIKDIKIIRPRSRDTRSCWHCPKETVLLDTNVEVLCRECKWMICPECGACKPPGYDENDCSRCDDRIDKFALGDLLKVLQ